MKLKIAIVHDTCTTLGGAERVAEALISEFPDADFYASLVKQEPAKKLTKKLKGKFVYSKLLSSLPISTGWQSFLKPLVLAYWKKLDFSKYDLVISSSHSYSSKSIIVSGKTKHVSYIHTPPKYLYLEFNEMSWLRWPFVRVLVWPILEWLRRVDFADAQKPHLLIANSKTTKDRITRYYQRPSLLIYPPVDLPNKKAVLISKSDSARQSDYLLCCSQFLKQKGVELIIQACEQLDRPLVVVGEGPSRKKLSRLAGPNTVLMGFVSDKLLSQIYLGAKAFITASVDEDFGITPVEAMGHGTPVLGYNSGGTRETVKDEVNGLLYHKRSVDGICSTIKRFESLTWKTSKIIDSVQVFRSENFTTAIHQVVNQMTND